jgi:glycosyltransferase involved in cell wall biosynthesis
VARAVLELLEDPRYRGQLGRAGRAYVERHHSLKAAAYELEQIYAAARGAEHADWRLDMGLGRMLSRELGG